MMSEGVEDPLWTAGDRGPQRRPRADQALRGTIATPAVVTERRSRVGQRRVRVAGGQRHKRAEPPRRTCLYFRWRAGLLGGRR